MNINSIQLTACNGKGWRCTVWVSGCDMCPKCKGCFNESAWDFNAGNPFSERHLEIIKEQLSHRYVDGITITGGDPLSDNNMLGVRDFISAIKPMLREDQTIWLYTGRERDEIEGNFFRRDIANQCDVIVCGRFNIDEKTTTNGWCGSKNQIMCDGQLNILATGKENLNDIVF